MNINMNGIPETTKFGDLNSGDVFMDMSGLYMKVTPTLYGGDMVNVVCLSDGYVYGMDSYENVIKIDGEFKRETEQYG